MKFTNTLNSKKNRDYVTEHLRRIHPSAQIEVKRIYRPDGYLCVDFFLLPNREKPLQTYNVPPEMVKFYDDLSDTLPNTPTKPARSTNYKGYSATSNFRDAYSKGTRPKDGFPWEKFLTSRQMNRPTLFLKEDGYTAKKLKELNFDEMRQLIVFWETEHDELKKRTKKALRTVVQELS